MSKYIEMTPHVSNSLRTGTPVVAIATGFFMRLPYPKNFQALQECERVIWSLNCVPCSIGVVDGMLKVGLNKEDLDYLCQNGTAANRVDLPGLIAKRGTAAVRSSAAMAIAKLAGIECVVAPGLSDAPGDIDALSVSQRMVFCEDLTQDIQLLYAARSIPVLHQVGETLVDAYFVQQELGMSECTVVCCERSIRSMAERACEAAIAYRKNMM